MLRKGLPVFFIAAFSISSFSQNAANAGKEEKTDKKANAAVTDAKPETKNDYPTQAVNTDAFEMLQLTFNRKGDPQGKGDLLLVEFALSPNTAYKYKLYIHVIATVEKENWGTNSFNNKKMFLNGVDTDLFVPYPDPEDRKNFEYQIDGKTKLLKFPHDYKTGVNPLTKEAYYLDKYTPVMTKHLAPYKKQFKYFNYATIIIFDDEGKLMFKQIYNLNKYRR
jgi:hypothetical protein